MLRWCKNPTLKTQLDDTVSLPRKLMTTDPLLLTSCQSPVSDPLWRGLAGYLTTRLDYPVMFVAELPWEERLQALADGRIHAGWVCGAYYVSHPQADWGLLAAPVLDASRYQHRPVYFSDMVVRRDHPATDFESLRGARLAINEPGSWSGYHVLRYQLARLCEPPGFFGGVVVSGGHQESLEWVLRGRADTAAIDSTVMDTLSVDRHALVHRLKVVTSLGPAPMPPWVVQRSLDTGLRERLQGLLLNMHHDPEGAAILAAHGMAFFAPVEEVDYRAMRSMLELAGTVALPLEAEERFSE